MHLKTVFAICAALALTACTSNDAVMRNAPFVEPVNIAGQEAPAPTFDIVGMDVDVPYDLSVSEANVFYPLADIVWRGEPLADRHAQVRKIFEDGITLGRTRIEGERAAVLKVAVHRFHSLTEKARYTTGGTHNMVFTYQLTDPQTGAALTSPKRLNLALDAYGGSRAIAAERNGITQRHRITQFLAQSFLNEIGTTQERPARVAEARPIKQF